MLSVRAGIAVRRTRDIVPDGGYLAVPGLTAPPSGTTP